MDGDCERWGGAGAGGWTDESGGVVSMAWRRFGEVVEITNKQITPPHYHHHHPNINIGEQGGGRAMALRHHEASVWRRTRVLSVFPSCD